MDDFNRSVLKYLSEMSSEIKKIKTELDDINFDIKKIKEEQEKMMSTFPNGLESHKNDHVRRRWLLFK